MIPSTVRLSSTRPAPWSNDFDSDESYDSDGSYPGIAAHMHCLSMSRVPIGVMIRTEDYIPGAVPKQLTPKGLLRIESEDNCEVCMEPLGGGDHTNPADNQWIVACPNDHAFHVGCVKGIFDASRRNNGPGPRCPVCRDPISLDLPQPLRPPPEQVAAYAEAERVALQATEATKATESDALRERRDALEKQRLIAEARAERLRIKRAAETPTERAARLARRTARLARRAARRVPSERSNALVEETLLVDIWRIRHVKT